MAWSPAGNLVWTLMYEYKYPPEVICDLDGYSLSFLVEGLKKHYEEKKRAMKRGKRRHR